MGDYSIIGDDGHSVGYWSEDDVDAAEARADFERDATLATVAGNDASSLSSASAAFWRSR